MEGGTIVKWHKKVGDQVQSGDVLFEVATDKATVEHSALDEGWLRKILVQEGEEAVINQPVAIFTAEQNEDIGSFVPEKMTKSTKEESKNEQDDLAEKHAETVSVSTQKQKSNGMAQPQFIPEPPLQNYSFEYPTERVEKRLFASPLAKKLAKEKGLDLTTIKGSGPNQRIMSRDLGKAQTLSKVNFGHREVPTLPPGSYEEIPLTPLRKVIGQRLQESKTFIPHFYVTQTINADNLANAHEQLKNCEVKVSFNDFIVKATALSLRQHPVINRGFNSVNQTIIQFKTIDIAIAVSIESGLITPIIRHADFKNLGEISTDVRNLAQKAREGKLSPEEYKGGSFTISNLGMFGVTEFQAIINPPQAAILAVSGIQTSPVVRNGHVVVGKILNLTLSVDHRVIDGVEAALFMQTLKKYIENPSILLIN